MTDGGVKPVTVIFQYMINDRYIRKLVFQVLVKYVSGVGDPLMVSHVKRPF